jgi:hypothetical protein
MYQKRILPYFIIPSTFSPQASSPLERYRQTEGRTTFFTPCYLSSFFFHWARGALPAGATLLGWPNYGVDGRLNKHKSITLIRCAILRVNSTLNLRGSTETSNRLHSPFVIMPHPRNIMLSQMIRIAPPRSSYWLLTLSLLDQCAQPNRLFVQQRRRLFFTKSAASFSDSDGASAGWVSTRFSTS